MASVENLAAGARAVFFNIVYPPPEAGFSAHDAGAVFVQLDSLFRAARAIADPEWVGAHSSEPPPEMTPAQAPRIRRIHMDWRHIEVVAELPWEFIVGGGLVGLVTMAQEVTGATPNLAVRIAQLSAEQADWRERRTPEELAFIERQTEEVLEAGHVRPSRTQIYLGEEDEMEGWTA